MHVLKTVFVERDDFTDKDYSLLKELNIIVNTDYGTVEILSSRIKELFEDKEENKDTIEILQNSMGCDLINSLRVGEVDFALVAYD